MKLFEWQKRAALESEKRSGWGLFAKPGTGKTAAALKICLQGDFVPFVVCPLAVKHQWKAEGVEHVHHYEQIRNRKNLREIAKELQRVNSCLILDESHRIANPKALTSKAALALAPFAKKRLVLTGTPTANSPADLWMQLRFIDPNMKMESYNEFRDRYVQRISATHPMMRAIMRNMGNSRFAPFVPDRNRDGSLKLKNMQELIERISDHGTFVRDDELADLPERTFSTRIVYPDADLKRAYREMREQMMSEINGQTLTAQNAAVLATRLLRLTSALGEDGSDLGLQNPKAAQLMNDLPQYLTEGKIIVWSIWIPEREQLRKAFSDNEFEFTEDPEEFVREESKRILLGSPKMFGAGLNLQCAKYQLWCSRSWSLIEREQALHRNYRVGQLKTTHVVDYITAGTIDERVIGALASKTDLLQSIIKGKTL